MGLAAIGETFVLLAVVMLVLFWVGVLVMVTRLVRRVRRGFRTAGARVPEFRGTPSGSARIDFPALRGLTAATIGSPSWWGVQRDRQRMWQAVAAAQRAVQVAVDAGAPVGDLPDLSQQLTQAARSLDAILQASAGGHRSDGSDGDLAAQRDRIETSARDIQRAAVDSLRVVGAPDADSLASAVRIEVTALAAGVRAAVPHPRG